ncbi:hypothetical protein AA0116_g4050 [Alternaria tenuissima]|nr:hypothetical protein AA0116_g4050 [Alternaria tenuissima]
MAGTRLCGAPKPSLPTTSRPSTLTPQARRTFQESFDSFEKTVQRYSRTDDREFSNTTLRDVRDAAKEVERQLAARQCMRNMKRLEPFLDGLEAYSKVIEVLCNGTPFLSWIWAPIKLMMQLATDHISAFEKLLAAYSQIAAMLPRFDRLGTALQDKPDFQQALAVVYSDILTFHQHAYKLFRRNGWICFFKSSWGQFGSRFNCILDSLSKHATLVDQEANAYLVSETMQWRREALLTVANTEKDRSTAQLTAALAWLGLETVPHCGQAYQDNQLDKLIKDCCDGTTDWILKHQRMRQWLQNGKGGPILWLKGKPGSGKSTLCAKIVQFLRAPRQSTVLFCFYSYIVSSTYPDPVVFILATLVSQILRQRFDLATYVYEEFVAESRPLSIRSLQELLSNLLPQLAMPRILVDGIDECIRYDKDGKPCDLTPVKDVLVSILQLENPMQAWAPTKILIVSRDILELVGKLSKRPTLALDQESDALTADITRYATKCLETIRDRFADLVGVDNVLNDVKRNVVLRSQGMFLWVRLVLAQLEFDAYNLDDLGNAVANMPHSLHDFYSRIVHRIMLYPTQSRERTINILKWMLCSKRPLRVIELQDAIVFASGAVSLSERSKLPPNIVDLCKPLIQTDDNGQISFFHFTVQEYLTKSNFISLRDAESCTTITCLNYLTFSLNLSNSSIPTTQKAVDVGRCLYSLQPYVHEHWLDHLLAFAAEVSRSTDQQLEAFLASFFSIYSHQYTRYLDPTDDLQVDILAAQTLEPRLQYLERYEHHYKFLCAYVAYRHAKQMHFENPADYREPLDPTPLSVVQLEYATQIDYLLSAVTVPGLTQEQLNTFKTFNRSYAFVCRFPGCAGMLAGFPTDDLRTQHEMTHKPTLFCTDSGCTYKLPFASQQSLGRHIRTFHNSVPRSAPKSIRHRQATRSKDRDDHAGIPNAPGGLDVKSQANPEAPIEDYSSEFMHLYRQPEPPSADSNLYTRIDVANDIAMWLQDPEALAEASGAKKPQDIFSRIDITIQELKTSIAPEIMKQTDVDSGILAHGLHPQWHFITAETPIPDGGYVGELNGLIGRKADYYSDASNRWDLLRHPEPFVFFPPHLPIYIDTRREGNILRYSRRSCNPNMSMKILVDSSSDYHFCFLATREISPGEELTVGWDIDSEVQKQLARVVTNGAKEGFERIQSWVSCVLANFGGCACDTSNGNECLLERARRNTTTE